MTPIGTSGDQVALTPAEYATATPIGGQPDLVMWSGERWRVFHEPADGGAHLRRLRSSLGG